jgi:hypothetical protein
MGRRWLSKVQFRDIQFDQGDGLCASRLSEASDSSSASVDASQRCHDTVVGIPSRSPRRWANVGWGSITGSTFRGAARSDADRIIKGQ